MKEWTFKIFVDENGVSDFLEWRKAMPPKARAKMEWLISHMEIIKDWTNTHYFRPLTGYAGICEIKFFVGNRQYRPLGCYGPRDKEFTILIGAEERGNKFKPLRAPEEAMKRRKLVREDGRYSNEYY